MANKKKTETRPKPDLDRLVPPAAPPAGVSALQRHQPTGPLEHHRLVWTPQQIQILKDQYIRGFTDAEFQACMAIAQAKGLDPLRRQIYFRKQKEKDYTTGEYVERIINIIGIDGFRAVADRTGTYDGQDEPSFEYDSEEISGRKVEYLRLARLLVYRKDISRPFVGFALFAEYVQRKGDGKPNAMWEKMPHNQLAKCAEAQAFRKAFPDHCGDLYAPEEFAPPGGELDAASRFGATPPQLAPPPAAAADDVVARWTLAIDGAENLDGLKSMAGKMHSDKMTTAERQALGAAYQKRKVELEGGAPAGAP